jgi:hypothetical protein
VCPAAAAAAFCQVEYKFGVNTYNMLKELGANITFKTYNGMAHGVSCLQLYRMPAVLNLRSHGIGLRVSSGSVPATVPAILLKMAVEM